MLVSSQRGAFRMKPISEPEMSADAGSVMNQPAYIQATIFQLMVLQSPLHKPTPTVAPVMHCVVEIGRAVVKLDHGLAT